MSSTSTTEDSVGPSRSQVGERGGGIVKAGNDGVAVLLKVVGFSIDTVDGDWGEIGAELLEDFAEADHIVERFLLLRGVRDVDADVAGSDRELVFLQQRLEREQDIDLIQTAPNVTYELLLRTGETLTIDNPQQVPDSGQIAEFREPISRVMRK